MITLVLRTDRPEALVALYQDQALITEHSWQAHRQLAETIHLTIQQVLRQANLQQTSLQAILIYKGPGSFTGLRIGMSVANAIAYAQNIPVHAELGDSWVQTGIEALKKGIHDVVAMPDYGAEPHITQPRR